MLDLPEQVHLAQYRKGFRVHRPIKGGTSNSLSTYSIWKGCKGYSKKGKENIFSDSCVALAAVVGVRNLKIGEIKSKKKRSNARKRLFNKRPQKLYIEIEQEVIKLKQKCPTLSQPITTRNLPNAIQEIGAALNIQVFVHFQNDPNRKVISSPKFASNTLPWISFLLNSDENHISLIKNQVNFMNSVHFQCYFCSTNLKNWNNRHLCKARKGVTCENCFRYIQGNNAYSNYESRKLWCNSNCQNLKYLEKCDLCGFGPFLSEECYENHQKKTCHRAFKCLICKQYISSRSRADQDEIRQTHQCGFVRCYFCHKHFPKDQKHICKFLPPPKVRSLNRLGFLSLTFCSPSIECKACFNEEICKYHDEVTENIPTFGNLSIEETQESFKTFEAFDDAFGKKEKNEVTEIPYLPKKQTFDYHLSNETLSCGKATNRKQSFDILVRKLANKQNKSVIEKLLVNLFTDSQRSMRTILSDSDLTMHELLKALVKNKFPVSINRGHGKLTRIQIKSEGICFLLLENFLDLNKFEIMKSVNPKSLNFFPLKINRKKIFHQNSLPDFSSFCNIYDSPEEMREKEMFYQVQSSTNSWNFFESLRSFSTFTHSSLLKASVSLLEESLNLLEELRENFSFNDVYIVSPYNYNSLANFSFMCMRSYGFSHEKLSSVEDRETKIQASEGERQLVHLLESKHKDLISNFSSERHQLRKFKLSYPDAFSKSQNISFQYEGCYYHPHSGCELSTTENQEKVKETERKRQNFIEANDVNDCIYLQECWFKAALKHNPDLQYLKTQHFPDLEKMNIRDAYRQPLLELYSLCEQTNETKQMYKIDVNSQFPHILSYLDIPTGDFQYLSGRDVEGFHFDSSKNSFTLKDGSIFCGIGRFLVLPPKSRNFFPILPYKSRKTNLKNIYTNCKTCFDKKMKICRHSDFQKAFWTTITSLELNYSASQQYSVLNVSEICQFSSSEPLLSDFFTFMLKKKVGSYGFCSAEDKHEFISKLNQSPPFKDSKFQFKEEDIKRNDILRHMLKNSLNKGIGHFSLSLQNAKTNKIIFQRSELESEFQKGNLIDFHEISDNAMELTLSRSYSNRSFLNSNVFIPAFVSAESRISIHKTLLEIEKNSGVPVMVNCDSILLTFPSKKPLPMQISPNIPGSFKIECMPFSFVGLSPRFYSMLFDDEKGQISQHCCVTGVNMSLSTFYDQFSHKELLQKVKNQEKKFIDETISYKIKHIRKKKKVEFNYALELFKTRFGEIGNYRLFPYGFSYLGLPNSDSDSDSSIVSKFNESLYDNSEQDSDENCDMFDQEYDEENCSD